MATAKTDRTVLSEEEIEKYGKRADELAKEHSVSKVHPIVQINPDTLERAVCYLSEPSYATKIRVMDKAATLGMWTAGDELRLACTIKAASDPITYGESPECDRYKMGITDYAIMMVKRLDNQFKKK